MIAGGAHHTRSGREIAVVGIACRFPHAHGPDTLWQLLTRGEYTFDTLDDEQLRAAGLSEAALAAPGYVRVASRIDGYDCFDAEFFGYTPKQAAELDPQQRVFLECAWEALEHTGCDPSRFDGSIGVMAGSGINRYSLRSLYRSVADADFIETVKQTLNADKDYLCTRVSYKLDLRGPSVAVQTACSTSLVAVHMACASLNNRECDMVLAGGVTIHVPHDIGYRHNEGSIFSPDGRCRVFDADAKGTVPGSGCGVVALRRLEDALRDGNVIHGVILNSAINNDGADKLGFAAPSVAGQEHVIRTALGAIAPHSIGLIEAHGTGTTLGDSIELAALRSVFADTDTLRTAPCVIGSIKSNIGHLDTASGIAGLIKALLCLEHAAFVPTLNVVRPNPALAAGPFVLGDAYRAWPSSEAPRRACVSSFGMGGTNCHVVLEEAARVAPDPDVRLARVFPLSAKSPTALAARKADLAATIRSSPALSLRDIAYTLQQGRKEFDYRIAYVASDTDELLRKLEAPLQDVTPVAYSGARLVFENTLPAAPWAPRLLALRSSGDVLPDDIDRCLAAVLGLHGAAPGALDAAALERALDGASVRLIVQYCSARKLLADGIRVEALQGVGGGALAAACVGGMLAVFDAIAQLSELRRADEPVALAPHVAVSASIVPCLDAGGTAEWTPADLRSAAFWHACRHGGATTPYYDGVQGSPPNAIALHIDALGAVHSGSPPPATVPASTPLELVAQLWSHGVSIDWVPSEEDVAARLVVLPPYPFERKRHWIDDGAAPASGASQAATPVQLLQGGNEIGFWFPTWSETVPPTPPSAQRLAAEGDRWLVLRGADGVGAAIAARLRQVAPGAAIVCAAAPSDAGERHLDPQRPDRYLALLQGLRDAGQRPTRIVHCSSVREAAHGTTAADFWREQESGYLDVLTLIQAWERVFPGAPCGLTVVGSGLAAGPWQGSNPHKATLRALAPIAAQELRKFDMRLIDLPWSPPGVHCADYSAWILADALAAERSVLIAYRERFRYLGAWQRFAPNDGAVPVRAIRRNGVYLITGGLGAVGLALAQSLAQESTARLVLTTRSAFPEPATWDVIAADANASHKIVECIRALRRIEHAGGEVLVVTADVADEASLGVALRAAQMRFGRVHGVFHLAGATHDASVYVPLRTLERAQLEAQARPKVLGLLNLERVLANADVDFVLAFSSNSATFGGVGFAAYAAANAAMDAITVSLPQNDVPKWLSFGWDGWATDATPTHGGAAMPPHDALRALWAIFPYATVPHVVISQHDLSAPPVFDRTSEEMPRASASAVLSRNALTAPYVAPRNELERMVVTVWERVLGVAPISVYDNCFELGADSLVLLDIIEKSKAQFHVTVPLRAFLSSDLTIATFAAQIAAEMAARMQDLDRVTNTAET